VISHRRTDFLFLGGFGWLLFSIVLVVLDFVFAAGFFVVLRTALRFRGFVVNFVIIGDSIFDGGRCLRRCCLGLFFVLCQSIKAVRMVYDERRVNYKKFDYYNHKQTDRSSLGFYFLFHNLELRDELLRRS
jgi:hypothetical protein